MKQKDIVKILKENGWWFLRNGANHDVYTNGEQNVVIPRHNEIKRFMAEAILKQCGIKEKK